jgi:hypothetical protein
MFSPARERRKSRFMFCDAPFPDGDTSPVTWPHINAEKKYKAWRKGGDNYSPNIGFLKEYPLRVEKFRHWFVFGLWTNSFLRRRPSLKGNRVHTSHFVTSGK